MSDLKRLTQLIIGFEDAEDDASIRYAYNLTDDEYNLTGDERDFLLALHRFVQARVDKAVHRHLTNYKHEDSGE